MSKRDRDWLKAARMISHAPVAASANRRTSKLNQLCKRSAFKADDEYRSRFDRTFGRKKYRYELPENERTPIEEVCEQARRSSRAKALFIDPGQRVFVNGRVEYTPEQHEDPAPPQEDSE